MQFKYTEVSAGQIFMYLFINRAELACLLDKWRKRKKRNKEIE